MELDIDADGTQVFYLPAGQYEVSTSGTLGGSQTVAIKGGGSAVAGEHVQLPRGDGTDFVTAAGEHLLPAAILGGYRSVVVASSSGASGAKIHFRRLGEA